MYKKKIALNCTMTRIDKDIEFDLSDEVPAEATDVTVTFKPDGTGTKVTLTHSNWEVFGDSAQAMRDGYETAWVHVFETRFKDVCLREPLEG